MRLIDADALSAELRERGRKPGCSELTRFVFDGFAEIVESAPTVEQTIRCGDCRYCDTWHNATGKTWCMCRMMRTYVSPTAFCSYVASADRETSKREGCFA